MSMITAIAASQKTADPAAQGLEKKKLVDAAQQFEAVFLQELLKPMRAGQGADAEGSEDVDAVPGADTMASYGTEALATAIAKSGGLGIARQIVAKVTLEKQQHAEKAQPAGEKAPPAGETVQIVEKVQGMVAASPGIAVSGTSVPNGAVQKKD